MRVLDHVLKRFQKAIEQAITDTKTEHEMVKLLRELDSSKQEFSSI